MSREEAAMRPRGEAQESEAPEGAPREVEGLRREARREPLGLAGSAHGAEPRTVDSGPGSSGGREAAQGRRLQQVLERQLDAEGARHPAGEPRRGERVATGGEEVAGRIGGRGAEHLAPEPAELGLHALVRGLRRRIGIDHPRRRAVESGGLARAEARRDLAEARLRRFEAELAGAMEGARQELDRGGAEAARVVFEVEREAGADREAQWEAGLIAAAGGVDGEPRPAAARLVEHALQAEALEDEESLEERHAARHLAPPLHLDERAVLELAEP